jgi:molecular chaperone GrpE
MNRPESVSDTQQEQPRQEPNSTTGSESTRAQSEEHQQNSTTTDSSAVAKPSELEQLRSERDALLDRLARIQADFDNARKRLSREQQEFRDFALTDALRSILPIVDSLDWAIQAPVQNLEELRSGVDLIRKQLNDSLKGLGLTPIAATGQAFDPNLHEAIEMVDTETAPDNQVLAELQRGYKLHERLLRPATVLVARNPGLNSQAD